MSEIKWIKLSTDIFNNRKIRAIEALPDGDTIIVIWLKLLILAGEINDGGLIYFTRDIPYIDQLMASQFGRPLTTIQLALSTFEKFGMVQITDSLIEVSNWEKYQNVEGLEKIREQNRIRKRNQREREKQLLLESHVTSRDSHATDKNREDKTRIDEIRKEVSAAKRFTPPTVDEVKAYCDERGNSVDPERFVDFYASKGWMVGKTKMKDWKATVRNWERSDKAKSTPQTKQPDKSKKDGLEKLMKKLEGN